MWLEILQQRELINSYISKGINYRFHYISISYSANFGELIRCKLIYMIYSLKLPKTAKSEIIWIKIVNINIFKRNFFCTYIYIWDIDFVLISWNIVKYKYYYYVFSKKKQTAKSEIILIIIVNINIFKRNFFCIYINMRYEFCINFVIYSGV